MSAIGFQSLPSRFRSAFAANRDLLVGGGGMGLMCETNAVIMTPSIRVGVKSVSDALSAPPSSVTVTGSDSATVSASSSSSSSVTATVFCVEFTALLAREPAAGEDGLAFLVHMWSVACAARHVLQAAAAGGCSCAWNPPDLFACVRLCLTAACSSMPDIASTLPAATPFNTTVASPAMSAADVASSINPPVPPARAAARCLPAWQLPCVWPAHRAGAASDTCRASWEACASSAVAAEEVVMWQALSFELLSCVLTVLGQSSEPDAAAAAWPGDLRMLVKFCCGLFAPCMPWCPPAVCALAGRLDLLCSPTLDPLRDAMWCRTAPRLLRVRDAAAAHAACAWVIRDVKYPHMTSDVVGHVIPLLLPLVDDYRPFFQCVGIMGLAMVVRHALGPDLVAHSGILAESFKRGMASTDATALLVLALCELGMVQALHGPPPHEAADRLLDRFVQRLSTQTGPTFQIALFSILAEVCVTEGIYMARHMQTILDLCDRAVTLDFSAPVCLSAVHTLLTLCVACWPRITLEPSRSAVASMLSRVLDTPSAVEHSSHSAEDDVHVMWTKAIRSSAQTVVDFLLLLQTDGHN